MGVHEVVISVVIPTHNRCALLGRAIESVLGQTYPHVELVIVDDSSTDATPEVVRSYSDKRICSIRHERNRGASASRNSGIEACNGDYIAFLDDDDEYVPDKLATMLAALVAAPNAGLAYSQTRIVGPRRDIVFPRVGPSGDVFLDYLGSPFFNTVSTLIRKEAVASFDEALPRWQDVDFHLRILKGAHAIFVPRVTAIVHWDDDRDRITLNADALMRALPAFEKRYFGTSVDSAVTAAHSRFLRHAGTTLIIENRAHSLGRALLRRSFRTKPDIRTAFDFAASFGGPRIFAATVTLRQFVKHGLGGPRS